MPYTGMHIGIASKVIAILSREVRKGLTTKGAFEQRYKRYSIFERITFQIDRTVNSKAQS